MTEPGWLLQAEGLRKCHGARVVFDGVGLQAMAGEAVALVGPSGCGKTTLLHLLAGLDDADGGHIRYRLFRDRDGRDRDGRDRDGRDRDGRDRDGGTSTAGGGGMGDAAHAVRPDLEVIDFGALDERGRTRVRRRWMGFVFQFYNLVPTLTVADNITLPRRLNRLPVSGDAQALGRLARLGLTGRDDAWPAELSGGEQQRVAIARALAHGPRVLFADEPTGNLDVRQADEVLDLLLAHARESGAAVIYATHSERLAARADRVLDMARDFPQEAATADPPATGDTCSAGAR